MKIFINYRREDEANMVFAIANALMSEFGVENVFYDRQAIKAGTEFPREIDQALESCRVFIPVIGKKWLEIMNKRQALDEKDYVLDEIVHAMDKGVIVLPVLVDDTPMPSETDLPPAVSALSLIHAVNITSDPKRLPSDIKMLIAELNEIFSRTRKYTRTSRRGRSKKRVFRIAGWIAGAAVLISAGVIFATAYIRNHRTEQDSSMVQEEIMQEQVPSTAETEEPKEQPEPATLKANQVTDIDGNIYNSVAIGDQVWMAENLKVTHYANGDPIPYVSDSLEWINLKTGAYCDYQNLKANGEIYGHLYNSYAIDDERGLCPEGWHVPIKAEFDILRDYLGGWKVAGGKLKETKYEHWLVPNIGATNSSGFKALPGGRRTRRGFSRIGYEGYLWSAGLYYLYLSYESPESSLGFNEMYDGYSIRCVKH